MTCSALKSARSGKDHYCDLDAGHEGAHECTAAHLSGRPYQWCNHDAHETEAT
jgi:hypothetical protein